MPSRTDWVGYDPALRTVITDEALDVEELVLEGAADLGGALPNWGYISTWEPRRQANASPEQPPAEQPNPDRSTSLPTPQPNPASDSDGKSVSTVPCTRPSLSGMSRQLAGARAETSQSLGSLLNTATGDLEPTTPFTSLWQGTQAAGRVGTNVASTTFAILGDILESAASGEGGSSSYSSSGSSRSSWSSSSSRSSFSRSSSSSRRSGGGGGLGRWYWILGNWD